MQQPVRLVRVNLIKREKAGILKKRIMDYLPFIISFFLSLLVIVSFYIKLSMDVGKLEKKLAAERQRLRLLEAYLRKLKRLERVKSELEKKKAVINAVMREARVPLMVMDFIENSIPQDVWLSLLSYRGNRLYFVAFSLSDESIADFVEKFSKNPMFKAISIGYIKKASINGVGVKEFRAEVILNETHTGKDRKRQKVKK